MSNRMEVLEAALQRIIEWCDGTRGPEDHERDFFEHIADCARKALFYGKPIFKCSVCQDKGFINMWNEPKFRRIDCRHCKKSRSKQS